MKNVYELIKPFATNEKDETSSDVSIPSVGSPKKRRHVIASSKTVPWNFCLRVPRDRDVS